MGRRLGQHFLHDTAILDRIVDAIDPQPDDTVIEIGPGEGRMTERLARRVGRVVAIEVDPMLAANLTGDGRRDSGEGASGRLTVVVGDALVVDWTAQLPSPVSRLPKVIGNIPYYITTPLIERALERRHPVVVFLMQKEVADRLAAHPGNKTYGALSVGVQAVARVERLFVVKAGAFHPPPNVDSAVVRLTPRADPIVTEAERAPFRRFVTALFSQRRKQLARSVRDVATCSREEAIAMLETAGIAPTARAESLPPEAVARLFRATSR